MSLNRLEGRVICRLLLGSRQHALLVDPAWRLVGPICGANLVWRDGTYSLHICQSREALPEAKPDGATRGVYLGITNLATDSEGEHFTGAIIHLLRTRHHLHRQLVGTNSAKRATRKTPAIVSASDPCRKLSAPARQSLKTIALEDLSGIRERTTVRRAHRFERHSWAFFQLRAYIAYKAASSSVALYLVDPATPVAPVVAVGIVRRRIGSL